MDDMVSLKNGGLLPFLEVNQALQALKRVEQKKPELLQELLHYVYRKKDGELERKLFRELMDVNEDIYFFFWDDEKDKRVMYSQMRQVLSSALEEKDGQVFVGDPAEDKK